MTKKIFNISFVSFVVAVVVVGFVLFFTCGTKLQVTGLVIKSQDVSYEQDSTISLGEFDYGVIPQYSFVVFAKYSDGSQKELSVGDYSIKYFFRAKSDLKDKNVEQVTQQALERLPQTKEEFLEQDFGRYYLRLTYKDFVVDDMYFDVVEQHYELQVDKWGWNVGETPSIFSVLGDRGTTLTQQDNAGAFEIHYTKVEGIGGNNRTGIYKNDGTDVLEAGFYIFHAVIFGTETYNGGTSNYFMFRIE